MLLTFLYHRINQKKHSNSFAMLKKHLSYLATHYKMVTPGEELASDQQNICLSFDDATFDFYHYVFPLLKAFNIQAVLAVPAGLIEQSCPLQMQDRLNNSFCTWKELKQMVDSGFVKIASHSFSHQNLLHKSTDLDKEIIGSKKLLESKLGIEVKTFVYPFGKFNRKIHRFVKKHYPYAMRIGSALNVSWQNSSGIIYRINSDALTHEKQNLQTFRFFSYFWFFMLNTCRRR